LIYKKEKLKILKFINLSDLMIGLQMFSSKQCAEWEKEKKKGFMVHYVVVEAMALDRCARIIIKNKKNSLHD
jgi:hypothetical protein